MTNDLERKNDKRQSVGRVLLISHEMSVTGAPNSLLRQAGYFRSVGYEVDVWTLAGGDLMARYVEAGFTPELIPDSRAEIKRRYERVRVRYALIICNTICTYRAVDVLQRYGMPVVWFVRETLDLDKLMWLNRDFAMIFRRFYNVYTVSDYAASVVKNYRDQVRVINNAIADSFSAFTAPADGVRFGFIGSICEHKGVVELVEAFIQLLNRRTDVELHIAGGLNNELAARLRERTRDLPQIVWHGSVQGDAKRKFFDAIDVLCVPSRDEASGLTVIEGAMLGKALIITDRVGANYLIDENNGRVVPVNDASALAAAMSYYAEDPHRLDGCGARSRELYFKSGTVELEKAQVLKMLADSPAAPMPDYALDVKEKTPLFHRSYYLDGTVRVYFKKLRLFSYRGEGVLKR